MLEDQNSSQPKEIDGTEYCYPDVNNSCVKISLHAGAQAALYSLLLFATSITILGNFVVIVSIAHFKQLHTPTNILVMSLALLDFLIGLIIMPFSMVRSVDGCWYFGDAYCFWHSSFDFLFTGASIFHLIFIAIDRYQAVCHPLQYPTRITLPIAGGMAVVSWCLAAAFAFWAIASKANVKGLEEYISSMACFGSCLFFVNLMVASMSATMYFILPVCVMFVLYAQIFLISEQHARKMEGSKPDAALNKISHKMKSERKAAKTLAIVVGTFNLCWMPYFITSVIDPLYNFSTPAYIYEFFFWLGYINSALNPIIYGLFYPWFRKTLYLMVTLKIFAPNSSDIKVYAH